MPLKIGIIVGEISGDIIAASLINTLKQIYPDVEVEGIVGPNLIKAGCSQLFPMDDLNVMGLIDPLLKLPQLLKIRKWIIRHFLEEPPDLFIGVDFPDFNLNIEHHLKAAGIPTVHYVSPSVWAWRQGRINTIKNSCSLMLNLFPFEDAFYKKHDVKTEFVGHPTADIIPLDIDVMAAKRNLELPLNKTIVLLLPGSRVSELKRHIPLYIKAAKLCYEHNPNLHFVTSLITEQHQQYFDFLKNEIAPDLPITTFFDKAYAVMSAADVVLVTSGTATLEVMLHKKPMIVAYKTSFFTYHIIKALIKVSFIALPNLLKNEKIVSEMIQYDATPVKLSEGLLQLIADQKLQESQSNCFYELHKSLRKNASANAAKAILKLLGKKV